MPNLWNACGADRISQNLVSRPLVHLVLGVWLALEDRVPLVLSLWLLLVEVFKTRWTGCESSLGRKRLYLSLASVNWSPDNFFSFFFFVFRSGMYMRTWNSSMLEIRMKIKSVLIERLFWFDTATRILLHDRYELRVNFTLTNHTLGVRSKTLL